MSGTISYCGLICSGCPVHLMSEESDPLKKEGMKREIMGMCREYYGIEYKLEEITECDGCTAENGRMFFACRNCGIRKCAQERGHLNCAFCGDYPCTELDEIFKIESGAKARLDAFHKKL